MTDRSRLSESNIWELQRSFFQKEGVNAWNNQVPNYITSNTFIAKAYAELVAAFIQDTYSASGETIYILELGSGSGSFAYSFLQFFFEIEAMQSLSVCFVMSDIAEKNHHFWNNHSHFQSFIEKGRLDFGLFDLESDDQIELLNSGKVIQRNVLTTPLVLLANYIWDSVPQDAFKIVDGQLKELLLNEDQNASNNRIDQLFLQFEEVKCSTRYYENNDWNVLLKEYEENLNNQSFLFPMHALATIEKVKSWTSNACLVVSGDKGVSNMVQFNNTNWLVPALHGSFSLPVNFHALKRYAEISNGAVLQTPHQTMSLNVQGLVLNKDELTLPTISAAFQSQITDFGPDEFFRLKKHFEKHADEMDLDQLIALLRMSKYDSKLFLLAFDRIEHLIPQATELQAVALLDCLVRVWKYHYPFGEEDVAYSCAVLYGYLGEFVLAVKMLDFSMQFYGTDASTYYNQALFLLELKEQDAAEEKLKLALDIDCGLQEAKDLHKELLITNQN